MVGEFSGEAKGSKASRSDPKGERSDQKGEEAGGRQTFSKEQMGHLAFWYVSILVIPKSPEHLPPLLPFPKRRKGDSAKW